MIDCIGQEINVGDVILWGRGMSHAGMEKMRVTKISKVQFTCVPADREMTRFEKPSSVHPLNAVVITKILS